MMILVFLLYKKFLVSYGIAVVFLLNISLWTIFFLGVIDHLTLYDWFSYTGIPLPLGFFSMFCC